MKSDKYVCPNCKKMIELSAKPKRSFMGFQRIPCSGCQKEFRYPLTTGYETFYWLLLVGNVVWITVVLAQGGMVVPNPIGIIVLVYVLISLVKSHSLKKQVAVLEASVAEK